MDRHLTAIRMRVNRAEYPSKYTGWRKDKRISVLRDMKWLIKRIEQLESMLARYTFEEHYGEEKLHEKDGRVPCIVSDYNYGMRRNKANATP